VTTNAVFIVFVEGLRVIQAAHRRFAQGVSIFAPVSGDCEKSLSPCGANGYTAVGDCWGTNCIAQELLGRVALGWQSSATSVGVRRTFYANAAWGSG
jgi:hypothetical protein